MIFSRHYTSPGKTTELVKSSQVTIYVAAIIDLRLNARV